MMARTTVSLNIKNPEVTKVAARLADLQGTTITAAVLFALRAELQRLESSQRQSNEIRQMKEFANRVAALPLMDNRTDDEILGYNAEGYLIGD